MANSLRMESTQTDVLNWQKHPKPSGLGRFVQHIINFNLERQLARPGSSLNEFWKPLIERYFTPNANLHLELKSRERNRSVPVRTSAEALPHLWRSMFDAGVTEERILLENPCEHFKSDGTIMVICPKTVVLTTYEKSTVLTNGHLIVTFQGSEKISYWKFNSLFHEELFTPDAVSAWNAPQFACSEYGIPTSVCHMLTIADSMHQLESKIGEEITRIANDPSQMARFQEYMASVHRLTQPQPENLQNRSSLYSQQSHPRHRSEMTQSLFEVTQGGPQKNALNWNHQRQHPQSHKQPPSNQHFNTRQHHSEQSHLMQPFRNLHQVSPPPALSAPRAHSQHIQTFQQSSTGQIGYPELAQSQSPKFEPQMPVLNHQSHSVSPHRSESQCGQEQRPESDHQKVQCSVNQRENSQPGQCQQQLQASQPLVSPEPLLVGKEIHSDLPHTPKGKKQRQISPRGPQGQAPVNFVKQSDTTQQRSVDNLKLSKKQQIEDIQSSKEDLNVLPRGKTKQGHQRRTDQSGKQSNASQKQSKKNMDAQLKSSTATQNEGKPLLSKKGLSQWPKGTCLTQAHNNLSSQSETHPLLEIQQQLSNAASQGNTIRHSKDVEEATMPERSKSLPQDVSSGSAYCAILSELAARSEGTATNVLGGERGRATGFHGLQDAFGIDAKEGLVSHEKELGNLPNETQRWAEQSGGDIFHNFLEDSNQIKFTSGNDDGSIQRPNTTDPNDLLLEQRPATEAGENAIQSRGQAVIEAVFAAASGKDGWGMRESTSVPLRNVKNGKGDLSDPSLHLLNTMTSDNTVGENASMSSGRVRPSAPPGLSEFRPQAEDAEASRKSQSQYQRMLTVSSDGVGQSGGTGLRQFNELQKLVSNHSGSDAVQGSGRQSERSVSGHTGMAVPGPKRGEGSGNKRGGKNSSSSEGVEVSNDAPQIGQLRGAQRKSRGSGNEGREKRQKTSNVDH